MEKLNYTVTWSSDEGEYVAECPGFPSLSWLDPDPVEALKGLLQNALDDVGTDPRVDFVRKDPLVGGGSCSSIEATKDDWELLEDFKEQGIETPQDALDWVLWLEHMNYGKALDQREGNDDDDVLSWYTEEEKQRMREGAERFEARHG